MNLIKNIITFFSFDTDSDKQLKYQKQNILKLDDTQVTNLSEKINDPILTDKIKSIVTQNNELRKHINQVVDSKTLTDESNKALTTMYLTLLRAEINIILRDLGKLYETEKAPEPKKHDIKKLLEVMTNKFNAINQYLTKYASKNGTDLTPPPAIFEEQPTQVAKKQPTQDEGVIPIQPIEEIQEGGKKYDRCTNYCKYIKYKIKYQNLKYNI